MRSMRSIAAALVFLALAAGLLAAEPGETNPAWSRLQTLVGDWKGTYAGSDAEGTGEVLISYRLVSNGTSLMETMQSGHDTNMITIYHPDGSRIMATHYCAIGNQPRMVASGLSANGRTLAFAFLDAANVTDPDGELMRSLVVTFQDPDHFSQAWTSRAKGKDQIGTFTYTRVK
jgi:hypothetical protein